MAINLYETLEYLQENLPTAYQFAVSDLGDGAGAAEVVIDQWMINNTPLAKTTMSLVCLANEWLWVEKEVLRPAGNITYSHKPVTKKVAHEIVNTCKKFHQCLQSEDRHGADAVLMQSSTPFSGIRISFMRSKDGHRERVMVERMEEALEKYFG